MRSRTIALLAGCTAFHWMPVLPEPDLPRMATCLGLFLLVALFGPGTASRLVAALALGWTWTWLHGALVLSHGLDPDAEGRDLLVEGQVVAPPAVRGDRTRFVLEVDEISEPRASGAVLSPGRVRLSWYGAPRTLTAGERWRFVVRLKRPRGMLNPSSLDYEAWLFHQRIRATGYVRASERNRRLADPPALHVQAFRQQLRAAMSQALGKEEMVPLLTALAIGDRSDIGRGQWEVLRQTGTSHLMAISGLHVGLVAGIAFWLGRRAWAWSGRGLALLSAPVAGSLLALLASALYATVAGLGVPTQRALVMVAAFLATMIARRRTVPSDAFRVALLAVLAWDPLSVLSPGFWLSFGAVAAILYTVQHRLPSDRRFGWGRVQMAVTLALVPMTFLFFNHVSLVAPVANLLAIPWVSFLVVPPTLLGTILLTFWPDAAAAVLGAAGVLLGWLWEALQWLAGSSLAAWHTHETSGWALASALAGVTVILSPKGFPARWAGILLMLPMLAPPARPPEGAFRLVLLDVGQGLAAVVHTAHHDLVYDAGPKFRSGFDTGSAVVVPYLHGAGVGRLDTLVVSHGGSDHAGGFAAVRSRFQPARVLAGAPQRLGLPPEAGCRAGQQWVWDGVGFSILHPAHNTPGNDGSCVLKVSGAAGSVLLTGDIEAGAEHRLLETVSGALAADVLVAPHHGSKTSSTTPFVKAVAPSVVLFPVGYRNRYGFPHEEVVGRYRKAGARMYRTAESGALSVDLGEGGILVEGYRNVRPRFWRSD